MKKVYFGADTEPTEVNEHVLEMLMGGTLEFDSDESYFGFCRLSNIYATVCDVKVMYLGEQYDMVVSLHDLINIVNGEVYEL